MRIEANRKIQKYYISVRNASNNATIPILPRALHSIRRLSEAHAKLRLSCEVTEEDVQAAIEVYNAAFSPLMSSENGCLDADMIDLGISQFQRDRIKIILRIIRKLAENGGAAISRIKDEAEKTSISPSDAMKILVNLKKTGEIMEIKNGEFVLS
jgi:replicative DNA helicase Mcm